MAYIGIGKSMLREGKYKEAMTYLKLGNDREYYSKALAKYRREYMREYFGMYMTIAIALLVSVIVWRRIARTRNERGGRDVAN